MNALDYIVKKYDLNPEADLPIEIPNVGKSDLVYLLRELDFKVGAEIGLAEGNYSRKLCEINPQMKIYGIDAWKLYGVYADYSAEGLNLLCQKAKDQLGYFPNYEIIKEFSMEAVKKFKDDTLDFVYIDANHTEPYITQDITKWSKKVVSGGIVSGHDYFNGKGFGVIKAVNKYAEYNNIKPWFVLGLGAKIPGLIRDTSRSWFWIKP